MKMTTRRMARNESPSAFLPHKASLPALLRIMEMLGELGRPLQVGPCVDMPRMRGFQCQKSQDIEAKGSSCCARLGVSEMTIQLIDRSCKFCGMKESEAEHYRALAKIQGNDAAVWLKAFLCPVGTKNHAGKMHEFVGGPNEC